jgi:hypothetical protein
MAKFKVLRPIEHSLRLYVPAGAAAEKTKSAAHGGEIAVDASGTIELSEAEAALLTRGQVEPAPPAEDQAKGEKSKPKAQK